MFDGKSADVPINGDEGREAARLLRILESDHPNMTRKTWNFSTVVKPNGGIRTSVVVEFCETTDPEKK